MNLSLEEKPYYHSFIVYQVHQAHYALMLQTNKILETNGGLTTTQWRILISMAAGGATTLSQIAVLSDIDKGLLSRNLTPLIDAGLIAAKPDPNDGRIKRLALTDKGWETHDRIRPLMMRRQEHLTRDLTEAERAALMSALSKIEEASKFTDF